MKYSNTKALTQRLLVALGLAAVGVSGVSGIAEAATCLTCHAPVGSTTDIRPTEAAWRNITTGSIRGSHAKHIPNVTLAPSDCTPCHSGAATYTTAHRDGKIQVTTGNYKNGVAFDQSGNPTLSNCTTSYCHSDGKATATPVPSPTWGVTSNLTCNSCHTDTGLSGKHAAHINNATIIGTNFGCVDCHSKTVSSNTTISTAANHLNTFRDYSGVKAGKSSTYTTSTGVCSASYCHSNGKGTQVSMTVNTWNGTTTIGCNGCHGTTTTSGAPDYTSGAAGTLTANSHLVHTTTGSGTCVNCHSTAVNSAGTAITNSGNHLNKSIEVAQGGSVTLSYAAATKSCATSSCHGGNSIVWGANTDNDTCTKCHGVGTVSPLTDKSVIAPVGGTLTGTGQVSNDQQVGAHQTHLKFMNGFSNYSTVDYRCESCHGTLPSSGGHANGSSTPQFKNLATKWDTTTTVPTYNATAGCNNTYCHNPSAFGVAVDAGTAMTPTWTQNAYIADGGKSLANCQVCHLVPGSVGFTKASVHTGAAATTDTSANQCNACHGHNGDNTGLLGRRHIDGLFYAVSDSCNGCHNYDTVGATRNTTTGVWSGGTWGGTNYGQYAVAEGPGAHAVHINYIKTRLGFTAAMNNTGTFGSGEAANVCGSCHTNLATNHNMSGATGNATGRVINFGDSTFKIGGTAGTSFIFGATNPVYSGVSGTSSSVTAKTCSNISCHYFTTPIWSTY